ncbi:MAG: holo-ACP synthase [Bacillota bacterium]
MSVGVDMIEVARVRRALESRGSRFAGRIFTDAEVLQCESRRNKFQSYAARFAAKEAVAKLIGTGFAGFLPRDIEILNAEMGKPKVLLHGRAKDCASAAGVRQIEVSMSHVAEYAVAVAAAKEEAVGESPSS